MNQNGKRPFLFALFLFLFLAGDGLAANADDLAELRGKVEKQDVLIQAQQRMIQELTEKMALLEARMSGAPAPVASALEASGRVDLESEEMPALPSEILQKVLPLKISGYVDAGYIDQDGVGNTSTTLLGVNSFGDRLSTIGLNGDSSFLLNELNLDLRANLSSKAKAVANFSFLPRKITYTTSGGTASTDTVEVNLAYASYEPFLAESNPLTETVLGDFKISLGKFESTWGLGYRQNFAPDRVNISRSIMDYYWTGYPVGAKFSGKFFKQSFTSFRNSHLTYNVAVINGESWTSNFIDVDRSVNDVSTLQGRAAYGLDVFGGFFEAGFSFADGARINQANNQTDQESFGADARFEFGHWTTRAEWDRLDFGEGISQGTHVTHWYVETFYEFLNPPIFPKEIPVLSLTPYYRYDTHKSVSVVSSGFAAYSLTDVRRHTAGLRYVIRPGTILKGEYQWTSEKGGVDDDLFLASFVQQF